jgi:hypothetical protein
LNQFTLLKEYLEDTIEKVLVEYSTKMKGQLRGPSDAARFHNQLVGVKEEGDMLCELDTFIGISEDKQFCKNGQFAELDNPYKDEIISKVKSIKFLIGLLPEASNREFNFQRRWLRDDPRLESTVSELIDEQTSYLKRKYDAFRKDLQRTLSQSISAFYQRSMEPWFSLDIPFLDSIPRSYYFTKLRQLRTEATLGRLCKIQKGNVESLIVQMNGTILDKEEVNAILSEKNIYDPFVIRMGWESFLEVSSELYSPKYSVWSKIQICTVKNTVFTCFKWNNAGICSIQETCSSYEPKGMKFY